MGTSRIDKILQAYDENLNLYERCSKQIHELIRIILSENQCNIHEITTRVKTRKSFEKKINKEDADYETISNITDIIGFRIITYFSDDVDNIAKIIEKEFNIDSENSIDKRRRVNPDEFGYLSLHYIARLNDKRSCLTEFCNIKSLCFEIQIRSILQHAWAEIEHDLGYKSKMAIPYDTRRSFSRLAGLLEIADIGFVSIRDELSKYKTALPHAISLSPQTVDINKDSIYEFIKINADFINIYTIMQKNAKEEAIDEESAIDDCIEKFTYFGIKNIEQLSGLLNREKDNIISLFNAWVGDNTYTRTSRYIPFFYLFYILSAKDCDIRKVRQYMNKFRIGPDSIDENSARLIEICQSMNPKTNLNSESSS